MDFIVQVFLAALGIATLLNVILKAIGLPTIIGYIFTGICLSLLFNITSTDELGHLAEFGIVFLMFTIGLEFSFKHLMSMKSEVFLNGSLQMLGSGVVLSLLVHQIFDIDQKAAIITGFALALSSTAIVLKILNDKGHIAQVYGRKAFGILLFQDIAVIPILLMIDIFGSNESSIETLILKTAASAFILIVSLFLIGKYVFNRALYYVMKTDSQEIFIATIFFTVVGASFLAHAFGFSYSLGAFVAGMLIAETQYKHEIEVDLIPFRDMLLGLFFITVGMQVNFMVIWSNLPLILGLSIFIMGIKTAVIYLILIIYVKKRVAIKSALCLAQVGEFSLAILGILRTNHTLDTQTVQILIAVTIISMIATPFIINNISKIADKFEGEFELIVDEPIQTQSLHNHFIICGYGRLGQEVVQKLKTQGINYLVLESDLTLVQLGRSRGENVFFGNATQKTTLEEACIAKAAVVILTVSNEQKLELISQVIKSMNLNINVIIRYSGVEEKKLFSNLGDNFHLIKEERAVARVLLQEALVCKLEKETGHS